jgi:hypothetical protein
MKVNKSALTVRKALAGLQDAVLQELGRQRSGIGIWRNLVVVAMHHQDRHVDRLQILGEISLGERDDAVVMRLASRPRPRRQALARYRRANTACLFNPADGGSRLHHLAGTETRVRILRSEASGANSVCAEIGVIRMWQVAEKTKGTLSSSTQIIPCH